MSVFVAVFGAMGSACLAYLVSFRFLKAGDRLVLVACGSKVSRTGLAARASIGAIL